MDWTLKPSHSRISPRWPMVGTVTSRMGMNGTELKEEEAKEVKELKEEEA